MQHLPVYLDTELKDWLKNVSKEKAAEDLADLSASHIDLATATSQIGSTEADSKKPLAYSESASFFLNLSESDIADIVSHDEHLGDSKYSSGVITERLILDGLRRKDTLYEIQNDKTALMQYKELFLSRKQIRRIENLQCFSNLKILRLDNNHIKTIQNLDDLINLEQLDLSFNEISVIENLSAMINLKQISLYSNKISEISGLKSLKMLETLSLGQNRISQADEINNLCYNIALRSLTLKGNPIYSLPNYYSYVLEALKNNKLLYLDGLTVAHSDHDSCDESVPVGFASIKEGVTEVNLKKTFNLSLFLQKGCRSASSGLQALVLTIDETLEDLASFFTQDEVWMPAVEGIRGYVEAKSVLTQNLQEVLQNFRLTAIHFYKNLQEDIDAFEKSLKLDEDTCQAKMKRFVKSFEKRQKYSETAVEEFQNIDRKTNESELNAAHTKDNGYFPTAGPSENHDVLQSLQILEKDLITIENASLEKSELIIDKFETIFESKSKRLGESLSEMIKSIEDLDFAFSSMVVEYLKSDIETLELSLETTDYSDFRQLANKEELLTAFNEETERHLSNIQYKEDVLQQTITAWWKTFFNQHRDETNKCSSRRIEDIKFFVQSKYNQVFGNMCKKNSTSAPLLEKTENAPVAQQKSSV